MTENTTAPQAQEHPPEEGQLIQSPEGIYRLLKRLQHRHTPLKLRFDSVADHYTSMVLAVNYKEKYFLIDEVFPKWGDELMAKAIPFRFDSFHDGCKIDAYNMQAAGHAVKEGSSVYKIPFPTDIHFLQRRQFFRATVRLSLNIQVRLGVNKPKEVRDEYDNLIPQNPTWAYEGLLRDLSAQGCQVEVEGDLREHLKNIEYPSCQLVFPNGSILDLGIAVRHVGYDSRRNESSLGCQFINLNPKLDRRISFIVNELQRDNARSAGGNSAAPVSELFQEFVASTELDAELNAEAEIEDKKKAVKLSAQEVHSLAVSCVESLVASLRNKTPLNIKNLWQVSQLLLEKLQQERQDILLISRLRTPGKYLYEHSVSVALLLADLTMFDVENFKSRDESYLKELIFAGLCHDLGKGLIPERIAGKAGDLTEAEAKIMHKHSLLTREILSRQQGTPEIALTLATENCERLDGSGHPRGVKSISISPLGKLAAVIDVFDAMTSSRIYRSAVPFALAYKRLLALSQQLDLGSVQQLIKRQGLYPLASLVSLPNGDLGFVKQQDRDYQPSFLRLVYNKFSQQPLEVFDLDISSLDLQERRLMPEDPAKYNLDAMVLLDELYAE